MTAGSQPAWMVIGSQPAWMEGEGGEGDTRDLMRPRDGSHCSMMRVLQ